MAYKIKVAKFKIPKFKNFFKKRMSKTIDQIMGKRRKKPFKKVKVGKVAV